ncbi:type VII toxin-antitoxin system HepT family RNase toxin [Thermobrachium celere]|uniref:DUF86 domain-containing protein n=1 Tax=Thermobrachium celere DSM 8682 TaxID=941824 RepID=R7RSY9_9CLOT|nr:DUF86 domain-containing protein [Thermobrachium celere]GFR35544.1 hypothetical protein TCEA9_13560 [Thermobrachium celere]CDF59149.1 hypothetical protein TCEL_02217 [Thermobrachium celere DSM 8682]
MIFNIDRDKILVKLSFLQDNINKLVKLSALTEEEFLSDFRNVYSAKYLLQTSIEAMLDISNHIVARNKWAKIESNKDSFEALYKNGIIPEEYIDKFFMMAKFRNRIVHMYIDIDDKVIYSILKNNIEDLKVFIDCIVQNM